MDATPVGPPPVSPTGRGSLARLAEVGVFGFVPLVFCLAWAVVLFRAHMTVVDFQSAYYPAAVRLLAGHSPYAATSLQVVDGGAFVNPALTALAFVPLGLVSGGSAQVIWMLACIACVPASLWVLDVGDWRLYGIAFLWSPVFDGWQTGNLTLPLVLAVALVWRYRDRPFVAGLITAAAISLKPFVWPLALWLLATRRFRATGWVLVWGAALNLVAWLAVGVGQIGTYLRLSARVTAALWHGGYAVPAVAGQLGLGRGAGEVLLATLALVLIVAIIVLPWVGQRQRDALVLAVLLMLVASPLVWNHYFSLLLVPLALTRPRLSLAWVVGVLMWPLPPRIPVYTWEQAIAWGATAVVIVSALRSGEHAADHPRPARLARA
jgi:hypothetical protein